jgi:hypothetical protein
MTAGEVMIGSWGLTLLEGGVTADEAADGSCRRAPFGGRLTIDKVTARPSREGPTSSAVATGSCRP